MTHPTKYQDDGWRAQIALMRVRMEMAVTALLLVSALYVILFGSVNPTQEWAIGVVGVVCGYWLRPAQVRTGCTRMGGH